MFQFQAVINENGKSRNFNFATSDNSFTNAAKTVMQNANVKDYGVVKIAKMSYDVTSKSFKVTTYEFFVLNGEVKNLTPVR